MTPENESRVRNIQSAMLRSYEAFEADKIFEGKAALEEAWIINIALPMPNVIVKKGVVSGANHPIDTPLHNNIALARILRDIAALRPSRSAEDYGVSTGDAERLMRIVTEMFNISAKVVSDGL
jgi:DNA-binding transcriptional MocR family regulator